MTEDLMKAVRLHAFGGPEVLVHEDALKPTPGAGELLVRVKAVGLNPPDWYLRDGMTALPPEWRPQPHFPITLGTDVSGVVAAVADDATGFAVGDEVFAMVGFPERGMEGAGAYAEYVTVPAAQVAHKPARLDHLHAAAAPMSLLTAWQYLIDLGHDEPNPLQPDRHRPVPLDGRTVLVNGAGGGVGHLAVQLARWRGAHVIAVASGRHEAMLRDLGAASVIDHTRIDAAATVRDVGLVVDAVGGPATARFLPTIRRGGALFPIFPLGFDRHDEAARLGVIVSATQVRSSGAQLAEIAPLLDDGTIRVVIDSVFPLTDAPSAHKRAARGSIQGKIVLAVD